MTITREKLAFYTGLLRYGTEINNGYIYFRPRDRIYGTTRYKRSRIRMILYLDRELEPNEKVRFKDGNKLNDEIHNLYIETTH